MFRRKLTTGLIAAAVAVATLVSAFSITAAAAAETVYDYSRPGSQHTVTMNSADILERLLDSELPAAERNYLVCYGEDEIKYDDGITTSYVLVNYDRGTLNVSAREYTYLTESGAEIVWTPARATLLGATKPLVKDGGSTYDTVFTDVPDDDDTVAVNVVYTLDITVSAELADTLLNKAYNDAPQWQAYMDEALADYGEAMEQYAAAKAEYDAYLISLDKHTHDTAAYNAYVIAKRNYDAALKKYNDYLAAVELYEAQLSEYEEYLGEMEAYNADYAEYSNYLNEYRKYENLYEVYKSQIDTVALCRSHLKIIELAKVKMSPLNRDLYSSVVNNSLVDLVLNERDTFENLPTVEVPPKVIDLADDATRRLRILLDDYFDLTTETAKYNYYASNYNAFHSAYNDLFDALYYLVKQSFMSYADSDLANSISPGEDRYYKLQILVAQLYLVCMAISDGPVETIDPSYLNKHESKKTLTPSNIWIGVPGLDKTLSQLIGDYTQFITDTNNTKPIQGGFPSVGEEPTPPTPVAEPKMPAYVAEPTRPTEVKGPGDAPDVVEDPGEAPAEVAEPTEPASPTFPSEIAELCAAYGNTVIRREGSFDGAVTFKVESSVDKRFINVETVSVTFHGTDGEPIYYTTVDRGTYADYGGPVPTKEADARASYAFAGWQTADGERVDITRAEKDLKLYPYFEATLKYYTVTWDVNGEIKQEKLLYGALPSYTGTPQKPSTGEHRYVFSGWSPEIAEVIGDVTYSAQFREQEILSSVPGVTVIFDGENFTFDATGSLVSEFDVTGILELRTPFSEADVYTAFATVKLTPQLLDIFEENGVSSIKVDSLSSGNAKRAYTVYALDADGKPVDLFDAELEISFAISAESLGRLRVRRMDGDGNVTIIPHTLSDGKITFTGEPNREYSVGSEYVTHPVSSDFANITTQNVSYFVGDTVKVNVELGVGKRLVKLYYRTSDGKETVIYNRTFLMPAEDVTVIAVVEEIMCNVTFMNEGSVLTTILVPYGEIPTPPAEAPKKASDGNFRYVFEGWSPEIVSADGDTVYTALYDAIPIEKVEAPDRLTIYEMLTIAVAVVFAIMLGAVIWVGVVVIKKIKR